MILTAKDSQKFLSEIQDAKYRRDMVAASIDVGLAFQISLSREKRGWSRQELASKADVPESTIIDLEDPDSEKHDLTSLLKIAAALDVALLVRLVPFTSMVEWEAGLSTPKLLPRSYAEDVEAIQEERRQSPTSKLVDSPARAPLITAHDFFNYARFERPNRPYENPRRYSPSAC